MKGIKSDIERYQKAVSDLYEYKEYLARKYHPDLGEEERYNETVFYLLEIRTSY
jgi:hypothetical protein